MPARDRGGLLKRGQGRSRIAKRAAPPGDGQQGAHLGFPVVRLASESKGLLGAFNRLHRHTGRELNLRLGLGHVGKQTVIAESLERSPSGLGVLPRPLGVLEGEVDKRQLVLQ